MTWRVPAALMVAMTALFWWKAAEAENDAVKAWIDINSADGQKSFTARAQAAAEVEIRYELTAVKRGPSGRSTTRQGGRYMLAAGRPKELSRLTLGLGAGDTYCLELRLYRGAELVSTASQASPETMAGCRSF